MTKGDGSCEGHPGKRLSGEFVMTEGDPRYVLETSEDALDVIQTL
jgi:hypothetical protein